MAGTIPFVFLLAVLLTSRYAVFVSADDGPGGPGGGGGPGGPGGDGNKDGEELLLEIQAAVEDSHVRVAAAFYNLSALSNVETQIQEAISVVSILNSAVNEAISSLSAFKNVTKQIEQTSKVLSGLHKNPSGEIAWGAVLSTLNETHSELGTALTFISDLGSYFGGEPGPP